MRPAGVRAHARCISARECTWKWCARRTHSTCAQKDGYGLTNLTSLVWMQLFWVCAPWYHNDYDGIAAAAFPGHACPPGHSSGHLDVSPAHINVCRTPCCLVGPCPIQEVHVGGKQHGSAGSAAGACLGCPNGKPVAPSYRSAQACGAAPNSVVRATPGSCLSRLRWWEGMCQAPRRATEHARGPQRSRARIYVALPQPVDLLSSAHVCMHVLLSFSRCAQPCSWCPRAHAGGLRAPARSGNTPARRGRSRPRAAPLPMVGGIHLGRPVYQCGCLPTVMSLYTTPRQPHIWRVPGRQPQARSSSGLPPGLSARTS